MREIHDPNHPKEPFDKENASEWYKQMRKELLEEIETKKLSDKEKRRMLIKKLREGSDELYELSEKERNKKRMKITIEIDSQLCDRFAFERWYLGLDLSQDRIFKNFIASIVETGIEDYLNSNTPLRSNINKIVSKQT